MFFFYRIPIFFSTVRALLVWVQTINKIEPKLESDYFIVPGLTNQSISVLNLSISILSCKTSTETAYLHQKSRSLCPQKKQNNYSDCSEYFQSKNSTLRFSKTLKHAEHVRKACKMHAKSMHFAVVTRYQLKQLHTYYILCAYCYFH